MLKEILERIEQRLDAVGLDATNASRQAGLGDDGIRNFRRAVKEGKEKRGANITTLLKLAPVLQTTAAWLIEGIDCGADVPPEMQRLWRVWKRAGQVPPDVQDRLAEFNEIQLDRYEKSLETDTNPPS